MEKKISCTISILLSLFLIACQHQNNTTDTEAIEYYNKLVGTSWQQQEHWISEYETGLNTNFPTIIEFASDFITIDNVKKSFDKNNNLSWDDCHVYLGIQINTDIYYASLYSYEYNGHELLELYLHNSSMDDSVTYYQINKDEEDKSDSETSIVLDGTYNFTNATPPQMNGSVTLSNGNWSYSGDKSSPAASNGTYTVSGNKITVKWNASGYEVSESITITESGTNSTWKSENSGVSTFFSMLFGVTGLEMTFTKS